MPWQRRFWGRGAPPPSLLFGLSKFVIPTPNRVSQNHYQVLGVAGTAAAADIKKAYRTLVVRYHPDKHGGDVRYEEQFKAVAVAYGVLSDPGRRATYDFQLAQAARRAEEARRPPGTYGPPPAPPGQRGYAAGPPPARSAYRTRPPAGARERHYQPIPQRRRFTRRDVVLTLALVGSILFFSFGLREIMERVSATERYEMGLQAYGRGEWGLAYRRLGEALHFRPEHGGALRRRGELAQLIGHDPRAARGDYEAALLQPLAPAVAADVLYRLGRCEADLHDPAAAELNYNRALALDGKLAAAYLARGETRLLHLHQPAPALADLQRGADLQQAAGHAPGWHYAQLTGLALAHLGRYAEAQAAYQRVLAVRPRDGRTYFLLGRLAEQTADSAAACGWFRQAQALGYAYAETAQRRCRGL